MALIQGEDGKEWSEVVKEKPRDSHTRDTIVPKLIPDDSDSEGLFFFRIFISRLD